MRVVIIAAMLIVLSNVAHAYPDYTVAVEGFTSEEIRNNVVMCMSDRLNQIHTDKAIMILEEACYYEVTRYRLRPMLESMTTTDEGQVLSSE